MTDESAHRATLADLNRNFVRSVDEADVGWFDVNLAKDFLSTNPDGSIVDREAFLAQIGRGSTVKNIRDCRSDPIQDHEEQAARRLEPAGVGAHPQD